MKKVNKRVVGVYPFGKIHDYIALGVSKDGEGFEVSDGTHTMLIKEVRLSGSANFAKPFLLRGKNTEILLTLKQVEKLLAEYIRLMKVQLVELDSEIQLEYEVKDATSTTK